MNGTRSIPTLHPWPLRILKSLGFVCARVRHPHGQVRAKAAPFGLVFTGPTADCITRHIYRLGSHEPEITRYLLDNVHIGPDEVAIDVGANLGWYSVLLDRLSADGAEVLAFEPDPSTYELLLQNLQANRASRVKAFNLALGAEPGVARLHRYRDSNNGRHTLMEGGNTSGGTVEVPVSTLERFWTEHDLGNRKIGLMKIDVEGYEYFVLKGAGELLQNCACILLEYAPHALRDLGLDAEALMEPLKRYGFKAHLFREGRARPIGFPELMSVTTTCDLFLTSRG